MSIVEGTFVGDTVEDILNALLLDAREQFGDDLNDNELSVIRAFYLPVAERLAEAQQDVGLVLSSAQIDNAEGAALDLLTALIGIRRNPSRTAIGEVVFSRENAASIDYVIPSRTVVQTDSRTDAVRFRTTEPATLEAGETEVSAPVEAVEGGVDGNLGSNALVVMTRPPAGIESVTNPEHTDGGTEEETDDELRERAKSELADGAKATAAALVSGARSLDGVSNVSIFINDTNTDETGSGGLPDHSFELVVEGGDDDDIGQFILETKAAGDTSYSGAFGNTVTTQPRLSNGQAFDVEFSRPVTVQLYVDVDMEVTDEYEGDEAVLDAIVSYVGGTLPTGNKTSGQIGVGNDILYGEIEFAVRSVQGIYDINSLTIGTSAPPTETSNISIDDNESPFADSLDGSIEINTTEWSL